MATSKTPNRLTSSIILVCILFSVLMVNGQKKSEKKIVMKNGVDSLSYALGVLIGTDLKNGGLTTINMEIFDQVLQKGLKGDSVVMTRDEASACLQGFAAKEMSKKAAENSKVANDFLIKNKSEAGVTTTESGLQYKVITMGTGSKPAAGQKVKVHYTGKLVDGKIFDSSVQRGEPVTFGINEVIPGWTEALQLMPVGSKWMLYIPPVLGYGDQAMGGIPAGSVLIFEVELLGIE